jgi:hypothetical protein
VLTKTKAAEEDKDQFTFVDLAARTLPRMHEEVAERWKALCVDRYRSINMQNPTVSPPPCFFFLSSTITLTKLTKSPPKKILQFL